MDVIAANANNWEKWGGVPRRIYAALGDDVSKEIFKYRFLYSVLGDQKEIVKMIREALPVSKALESPKLCFYGAGKGAEWFLNRSSNWLLDGNPSEQPVIDNYKTGILQGHPIITFEQFLEMPDYKEYLVVTTIGEGPVRQEVEAHLKKFKIRYLSAYSDLNWLKTTYFDLPYMEWGTEYFVDAGALDGETTQIFFRHSPDGYAYVFEPSAVLFEQTKDALKNFAHVECFPYGLYDSNTTLHFDPSGARIAESGDVAVEVRKLDDLLGGRPVTFLKMDIEGSELAALRGAENIIRTQRPKLAISVYHKPEDIWEIPDLILDYCHDYKLYLRHYTLEECDTVLFAI
ncbi:MAG: FkbM family methyltransferase [Oscillospiraceae bacterium]|nr:FkbM family methyltransferase [Oscillospiraceae bacterium]